MPSVISLRSPSELSESNTDSEVSQAQTEVEKIQLLLPSACSSSIRLSTNMIPLVSTEAQLRVAQAYDALAYIKKLRRILVSISAFKHQHVAGTGNRANTRIRTLYEKFQGRIKLAASRYRTAFNTLPILDPDGSWKTQLKVLEDEDIRGPSQEVDEGVLGEGRREHSWIWLVGSNVDSQTDDSETKEAMRVEWGKTWARVQRWTEEVKLLQEEMRRVLAYLEWKAKWWRLRATQRSDVDSALASGLTAYAEKQAVILERLAQKFAKLWSSTLTKQGLKSPWQKQYDGQPKARTLWEVERLDKELDQEEESSSSDEETDSESDDLQGQGGKDSETEMQDV